MTLPADVARCRGRAWPADAFLAEECQTCERWIAHYCHDYTDGGDGAVARVEPPMDRECPLRMAVDDSKTPNDEAQPTRRPK